MGPEILSSTGPDVWRKASMAIPDSSSVLDEFQSAIEWHVRRSASLAIPHRKSFAAILSVSKVHLGHTNRNVSLSHEPQREIPLL